MARTAYLLALVSVFAALVSAFSAPTFCKCTCFTNSTIIPLGPQHGQTTPSSLLLGRDAPSSFSSSSSSSPSSSDLARRSTSSSCSQCNRAFCLENNLPFCKGAEEKDIFATCFQRDSRKDQIIVWGFLLGTGGLLGWAAAKRVVQLREAREAAAAAAANSGQAPLLGGRSGNGPAAPSGPAGVFQRLADRTGFGGRRTSGSGSGGEGSGLPSTRSPYARLSGD